MVKKKKNSKKQVSLNQHVIAALVIWVLFVVNMFRYVIVNQLSIGNSIIEVIWVQMMSEVFIGALIVASFVIGWRAITARMGRLTLVVGAVTLVMTLYFFWDLVQWTNSVATYWAACRA